MNANDVDNALQEFRDVMSADGYLLRWEPTDQGRVVVTIEAGEGACADCLVPKAVMEAMMAAALEPTAFGLDHVVMPGSQETNSLAPGDQQR